MDVKFKSCCCCVDLRIGSIIIASLNLIVSIAIVLNMLKIQVYVTLLKVVRSDMPSEDREAFFFFLYAFTAIIFTVNLVFTRILLIGLCKKIPGHVRTYLLFAPHFIVSAIILVVIHVAKRPDIVEMIFFTIVSLIVTYFLLVIRSYYLTMENENNKPGTEKAV